MSYSITRPLKQINEVQRLIFNYFLAPEKISPHYQKNILKKNIKLFKTLHRFSKSSVVHESVLSILERFIEIIYALGLLRYRVSDPALYKICKQELSALHKTISFLFTHINNRRYKDKIPHMLTLFHDEIYLFELIYQRTLQVLTPDSFAFLFFIQNLYALQAEFLQLSELT